jgi:hypothetical protein
MGQHTLTKSPNGQQPLLPSVVTSPSGDEDHPGWARLSAWDVVSQRVELSPAAHSTLQGLMHLQHWQLPQAARCFASRPQEAAYLLGLTHLLMGEVEAAQLAWDGLLHERPRHWARTLISIARYGSPSWPSYLQIRNHLESSFYLITKGVGMGGVSMLSHLFWGLLDTRDRLGRINPDTLKSMIKTLLSLNPGHTLLPTLFDEAVSQHPFDSEVYAYLASYWAVHHDRDLAFRALSQAQRLMAHHPLNLRVAQELQETFPDG